MAGDTKRLERALATVPRKGEHLKREHRHRWQQKGAVDGQTSES
jgi:hypothetical protein